MEDKKIYSRLFGEIMRELRIKQGLTQDDLAERTAKERSHISALERSERGPALSTVFEIAEGLGIKAHELIGMIEQRIKKARR